MKKIFALILVLVMALGVLSLTACTDSSNDDDDPTPITITDQTGRTVTINQAAERIVSGYYISSSACIALGLEDKLVGVETGMNQRPIYGLATELSYDKVADVGTAKAFGLEAALAANPDLVILPKAASSNVEALEELDIPVVVVNPESHNALVEMIEIIAKLTGTQQKADQLIKFYNDTLAKVNDLTKDIETADKPTVYIANPSDFLQTAPKDMYQASLIASAGGINAGNSLNGSSWTTVSNEQIVAFNPDIIIVPTNSNANAIPGYVANLKTNYTLVPAVQNDKVYTMPIGLEAWDSPVPSGVLGVLWMLNTLHPELYTLAELEADVTEFYETIYGFDLPASIVLG